MKISGGLVQLATEVAEADDIVHLSAAEAADVRPFCWQK
jgi:hypothetical protein